MFAYSPYQARKHLSGIFSVYLRGRLWAPVPMPNTLIFSQFNKKNHSQKINLSSFQQLFSFLSLGCSFFQFKVKW